MSHRLRLLAGHQEPPLVAPCGHPWSGPDRWSLWGRVSEPPNVGHQERRVGLSGDMYGGPWLVVLLDLDRDGCCQGQPPPLQSWSV